MQKLNIVSVWTDMFESEKWKPCCQCARRVFTSSMQYLAVSFSSTVRRRLDGRGQFQLRAFFMPMGGRFPK
jgi:hypothetical protein